VSRRTLGQQKWLLTVGTAAHGCSDSLPDNAIAMEALFFAFLASRAFFAFAWLAALAFFEILAISSDWKVRRTSEVL
jgi:hypothetical protein